MSLTMLVGGGMVLRVPLSSLPSDNSGREGGWSSLCHRQGGGVALLMTLGVIVIVVVVIVGVLVALLTVVGWSCRCHCCHQGVGRVVDSHGMVTSLLLGGWGDWC